MQIKNTDYKYDGFNLGDDVYLKNRNGTVEPYKIVGFDEEAYSLCYAITPLNDTRTRDRAIKLNDSGATTILKGYEHVTDFLWASGQVITKIIYPTCEKDKLSEIIKTMKEKSIRKIEITEKGYMVTY